MPLEPKQTVQSLRVYPLRGMDQRWRVSPNAAETLRDLEWNIKDGWQDAGGYRELTNDYDDGEAMVNSYDAEPEITSLTWFSQHNGAIQWLVYTTATGRLSHFNGSKAPLGNHDDILHLDGTRYDGSARSVAWSDGASAGMQYQVFGNNLYMVNGISEPLVWDGIAAGRAGFPHGPRAPDAFVANRDTTDDYDEYTDDQLGLGAESKTCGYRYRVSYLNDRGQESPLSEPSSTVKFTNSANGRHPVTLVLPKGDINVTGRRIYRTQDYYDSNGEPISRGLGEVFYFLAQVDDNCTDIYVDVKPDTSLGSAVDETDFGSWPSGATLIGAFKNTLFLATATDSRLFFSAPNMPEVFPPDNVFDLGDSISGPITAIYPTKNALVAFKERGIYLIKGDPLNGFFSQTLTRDLGCSAPGSVRELPGLGVAFLSSTGGVYLLQGALENTGTATGVVHLSTQIPDEMANINRAAVLNTRAAVYHRAKEYWLAAPRIGEHKPTRVLVYNYEVGAWGYRENYPIGAIVETGDHRGYLIFGSHDTTNNPGLYVYSRGWADKGGTYSIAPLYESTHVAPGELYRSVIPHRIGIYCVGYGAGDIQATYVVNRQTVYSYNSSTSDDGSTYLTHSQRYALDEDAVDAATSSIALMPVYGTHKFATVGGVVAARWARHRPVTIQMEMSTMHEGPVSELQISLSPAGRRMQIIGWEIEADVSDQRRIIQLSENYGGGSI